MGRPARPKKVEVVALDAESLERRYRNLSIWFLLTQEGVQLTHAGSVRQRLQGLEEAIDQRGLRDKAEKHLRYLADCRRRWPGGADDNAA